MPASAAARIAACPRRSRPMSRCSPAPASHASCGSPSSSHAPPAQAADRRHQVERAAARHGDVGRDRRRSRDGVSGRHLGQDAGRCDDDAHGASAATLDTIVATNLHADILSDLAAALAGSLGIAPTANLNPERTFPSMFEPIHGSAFDIAGKGIANPVGDVLDGGDDAGASGRGGRRARLMRAIERVTADKRLHTPDLGGTATTQR